MQSKNYPRTYLSVKSEYELIQWKKNNEDIFLISCPTRPRSKDLKVNRSAFDILKLMDGKSDVPTIAKALQKKYSEKSQVLTSKISAFAKKMVSLGVVESSNAPKNKKKKIIKIKSNYWLRKLQIEICSRCNLRCKHCYVYEDENKNEIAELPTQKIKDIIDQGKKMGVEVISLTGGEPFLREDIFDILTYIENKNMATIILSNGTLIDPETAKKLSNFRSIFFAISLDGPKDAHEGLRGVNGCFERTLNGIKNLLSVGLPVRINLMLSRYALNKSHELITILKELGYDKPPRVGIIMDLGRAQRNDVRITVKEFYEEYRRYWNAVKEHLGLKRYPVAALKGNNCGIGEDSLTITSEGNIIPCPPLNREPFILGNIFHDKLQNIWSNSKMLKQIRNIDMSKNKKCRTCKHWEYCKGGCRISAMLSVGALTAFFDSPNPFACARWKAVEDDITIVKEPSDAFLMSQLI